MLEQVWPVKLPAPAMPTAQVYIVGRICIERDFGEGTIKVNEGVRMPGHSESQSRSGAAPMRAAEAFPSYLKYPHSTEFA
ncbi:hypothetical protein D3C77_567970 [compost metagenome]